MEKQLKITKEMTQAVHDGLMMALIEREDRNALVTMQTIEKHMWINEVKHFVPTQMVVSALIKKGHIKYSKLPSGKLIYGFSQQAMKRMEEMAGKESNEEEETA